MEIPYKIYLSESEMPRYWYNVRADMQTKPAPLLNPGTHRPMTAEELSGVFCEELVKQELDNDTRFYPIPEDILSFYRMYRPSPLVRAYCLEEKLKTPAKIYYKFEGNNTSGSHKLLLRQDARPEGRHHRDRRGPVGHGPVHGLQLLRPGLQGVHGEGELRAEALPPGGHEGLRRVRDPLPLGYHRRGPEDLSRAPGHHGQPWLRHLRGRGDRRIEPRLPVRAGQRVEPGAALIIGCAGGGSNLGGLIAPFMGEKLRGEADYRFVAVEPASCPSLTRGVYAYDFCDTGAVCPLAKMYTLGSDFIPAPNHAGGLRYHGMSPVLSELYHQGMLEAVSVPQTAVFEAAEAFARVEGILPAPESSHAIKAAMDEAIRCRETGEAKTILFGLTGTGYFDLVAYEKFHNGQMDDYVPTDEELARYAAKLPKV